MALKYVYVGTSEYLEGVPARDLDDGDLGQLSEEQVAAVKSSPLYQTPTQAKKPIADTGDGAGPPSKERD